MIRGGKETQELLIGNNHAWNDINGWLPGTFPSGTAKKRAPMIIERCIRQGRLFGLNRKRREGVIAIHQHNKIFAEPV